MMRTQLGDVPVLLLDPPDADGDVVLWLSHLGGSAEKELPTLQALADAGHPVVSFDAPLHGGRAVTDDRRAFATTVLNEFRLQMWPILGRAALEAMRVLDWAQDQTGQRGRPVRAGGVSMGGDIAIALAGIDDRVSRVASIGSTPNWQRPDMRRLDDPSEPIDQGAADRYAQWFADQLDPARHLERYRRDLVIAFELGGADHHIPLANAEDFRSQLGGTDRIRITSYPGLDHFGVTTSTAAIGAAVHWLSL